MKTKFTCEANGKEVQVVPSYHTGGNANGPVAWIRRDGEPTGCAIAVAKCDGTAKEHSISYFPTGSDGLTGFQLDGNPSEREVWFEALYDACLNEQ